MTDEARRSAQRAILALAADCEASRQSAVQDRDWPRAAGLEHELRELRRQYADLERQVAPS